MPSFVKIDLKKTARSLFIADNLNSWPKGHSCKVSADKQLLPVIYPIHRKYFVKKTSLRCLLFLANNEAPIEKKIRNRQ